MGPWVPRPPTQGWGHWGRLVTGDGGTPRAPTTVPQCGDNAGVWIRPHQLLNPDTPHCGSIPAPMGFPGGFTPTLQHRSQPHTGPRWLSPTRGPLPIPPGQILHRALGSRGELGQAFFFPNLLYIWVHFRTKSTALKRLAVAEVIEITFSGQDFALFFKNAA